MLRRPWLIAIVVLASAGGSCSKPSLEGLLESRRLAADLLLQFTKVVDSGNRAVMSEEDAAASAFAREAEQTTQVVQQDVDALKPILTALAYSNEAQLLQEFEHRFSEYRTLDAQILGLAVENSNLKAQRLSFGPAQQAADAFNEALDPIVRAAPAPWRGAVLAASAIAAVREIQVLQAPHIAEGDDAAMTRIEARMMASEGVARSAVQALSEVLPPDARSRLTAASAALDRLMSANAEIIGLSRRNSNVRSLALSLGQKRMLTARCDETARSLRDALEQRSISAGTR
jgi:hypothetical protein